LKKRARLLWRGSGVSIRSGLRKNTARSFAAGSEWLDRIMTGNEGLLSLLGILNELNVPYDQFDRARFERRVKAELSGGVNVWMPRPEDVLLQKLRWAKGAARSKDFDDVVAVLKFQRELDFNHIEHWCGIHGTLELLEEARAVAGE
jgi:hypothetical protein